MLTYRSRTSPTDSSTGKSIQPTNFLCGLLQRPWRRVKKHDKPETVFVMVRRNCKVYANLGITRRQTRRYPVILDTGAGSSFIKQDILLKTLLDKVQPLPGQTDVRDASNRRVRITGSL